jgi:flagellar protein FliS
VAALYDRPLRAYLETKIRTAPPVELANELARACLRAVEELELHVGDPDPRLRAELGERVIHILLELNSARPQGETGEQLQRLYAYCADRVTRASLLADPAGLSSVRRVLGTLRQAWVMTLPQG